ncbi:11273_t:CDS:1, partial [Acaulospora colombiana]
TYAVSDPSILSKDRDIRIFSSIFFVIWAFLPIPVVGLAFLLRQTPIATFDVDEKAINAPTISTENGREENSCATSSEGTVVERDLIKKSNEKIGIPQVVDSSRYIPLTGYGTTPLTRWELWENAVVVIILAILLTIEQGVRVAQVYYLPKR